MTAVAKRPRPHRSRRRALAVLIAVELLAVGTLSVASAAQLTVSSSRVGVFSAARCSSTTLSVHVSPTGVAWFDQTKDAVQITNYPGSCDTGSVTVAVLNSAGTLLTTGTATCSGSPCVIPTGNYNAMNAAQTSVLISTWGVPASWDSVCVLTVFGWRMTCT